MKETRVVSVALLRQLRILVDDAACDATDQDTIDSYTDLLHECDVALSSTPLIDAAQANDAGRYRKLKKYVTTWESKMPETLGKLTLSVEFEADGDDLDAALDRIEVQP